MSLAELFNNVCLDCDGLKKLDKPLDDPEHGLIFYDCSRSGECPKFQNEINKKEN